MPEPAKAAGSSRLQATCMCNTHVAMIRIFWGRARGWMLTAWCTRSVYMQGPQPYQSQLHPSQSYWCAAVPLTWSSMDVPGPDACMVHATVHSACPVCHLRPMTILFNSTWLFSKMMCLICCFHPMAGDHQPRG